MADEVTTSAKPKPKLWDGALKMVRGDNTAQLIEQFTAEMTLVAEGLCEDQTKLRKDTDRMITEEDRRIQKLQSTIDLLETTLEEERRQRDQELTETRNRLAALEKKTAQAEKSQAKEMEKKRNLIRDLTWLVGIAAGAWVIVTLLQVLSK